MASRHVAIGPAPLAVEALVEAVSRGEAVAQGQGHGAVVTFVGLVRQQNRGRRVVALEYEAYQPLALRCFSRILDEAAAYWPSARLALHHRTGRLAVGEASVVIAAGAPHRADAFSACRYAIERVKQIAPVWKREVFEGGEAWIEGAAVDPDDERAREEAYRRACA
jgi:molybdopterin synthase catalytic subunit